MGAQEFGQVVEAERLRRGWTRSKLAVVVGILDDGSALDATQIRRIVEGTRKLDHDIVRRLIEALDLDPYEAWPASGLIPPRLDAVMLRKLDAYLRSEGAAVICGYLWSAGHRAAVRSLIPAAHLELVAA